MASRRHQTAYRGYRDGPDLRELPLSSDTSLLFVQMNLVGMVFLAALQSLVVFSVTLTGCHPDPPQGHWGMHHFGGVGHTVAPGEEGWPY